MALIEQRGTRFSFSLLPLENLSKGEYAKIRVSVENEFVSYQDEISDFTRADIEDWVFGMFRLLAGGYAKEQNFSFMNTGFAVDLYPYMENGEAVSREERRKHDCIMAVCLSFRTKNSFLGGVYSLVLHKEEIERFATALREEYYETFSRLDKKEGKYLCVGVSPQGYKGCNYWYLDLTKSVKAGDYVWVYMGRRNIKQIVYVDGVRYCDDNTAPCSISSLRSVVKKATDAEVEIWKSELNKGKNGI